MSFAGLILPVRNVIVSTNCVRKTIFFGIPKKDKNDHVKLFPTDFMRFIAQSLRCVHGRVFGHRGIHTNKSMMVIRTKKSYNITRGKYE